MEQFEIEFVGPQLHMGASHDYHPFDHYPLAPSKAGGGGRASAGGRAGGGGGSYDQWDSLEPLQAPPIKRSSGQKSSKRQRDDQRGGNATAAVLEQEAGGYSLPPAPSGVLGALSDGGAAGGALSGGGAAAVSAGGGGGAAPPMAMRGAMGGPPPHMSSGAGGASPAAAAAAGAPPPLVFTNTAATANLLDAAPQPQLPGRLLRLEDITGALVGKLAEMFWPDDNMWYLIEIQRVNPIDKTATIVYKTGEIEDLNLQEIAQEGHMSLIDDRAVQ
jgi:hypothetical protein